MFWCAEVKTEVAARRLERMEREKDDADDAEHEADLQEALTNQTKAVRLVVDKWFVDRGFGFGRTTTGEIVIIHASVVQGADALMVGTDWAQVVSDHARAEWGTSSGSDCRAGSSVRKEDRRGVRPARWLTPPGHCQTRGPQAAVPPQAPR